MAADIFVYINYAESYHPLGLQCSEQIFQFRAFQAPTSRKKMTAWLWAVGAPWLWSLEKNKWLILQRPTLAWTQCSLGTPSDCYHLFQLQSIIHLYYSCAPRYELLVFFQYKGNLIHLNSEFKLKIIKISIHQIKFRLWDENRPHDFHHSTIPYRLTYFACVLRHLSCNCNLSEKWLMDFSRLLNFHIHTFQWR